MFAATVASFLLASVWWICQTAAYIISVKGALIGLGGNFDLATLDRLNEKVVPLVIVQDWTSQFLVCASSLSSRATL